ncbi:GumC family protein [Longibacter salinarum]|nr:tyrosine-protein kinase family protein [Longibacter salinarum]
MQSSTKPRQASDQIFRFVRLAWRGKWVILGLTMLVAVSTYAYYGRLDKVYRSSAVFLLRQENAKTLSEEINLMAEDGQDVEREIYYLNESDVFLRHVAERIRDQADDPDSSLVLSGWSTSGGTSLAELASRLRSRIRVTQGSRDVESIRVVATGGSPDEAVVLANTLVETYFDHLQRTQSARARATRQFLEQQRGELERELQLVEDSLSEHIRERGPEKLATETEESSAFMGNMSRISEEISSLEEQRGELELKINMEQALLDSARSRYKRLRPDVADRAASTTSSELEQTQEAILNLRNRLEMVEENNDAQSATVQKHLREGRTRLANLEAKAKRLADRYVRESLETDVVESSGEGGELTGMVDLQRQIMTRETRLSQLRARTSKLEGKIAERKRTLSSLGPDRTLTRLERRKETLQELFLTLSKSLQKAQVAENSSPEQAQVIRWASPVLQPIRPDVSRNVGLALCLGLILSFGLVLVYDKIDDVIERPEDVERSDEKLFGTVPEWDSDFIIQGVAEVEDAPSLNGARSNGRHKKRPGIVSPYCVASEAYRHVATNIRLGLPSSVQTIVVTSPGPGDGKTTMTANLGPAFSEAGCRTLLIDLDLRKPSLHRAFGENVKPGVTDFLGRGRELEITDVTGLRDPGTWNEMSEEGPSVDDFSAGDGASTGDAYPGRLGLVTAGNTVPQPGLLLHEQRIRKLVDRVENDWDLVIIDTPPARLFDDAHRISNSADVVLLVASADQTSARAFSDVKDRFHTLGSDVVVGVLNRYSASASPFYGYGQTYAYGGQSAAYSAYGRGPETPPVTARLRRRLRTLIKG